MQIICTKTGQHRAIDICEFRNGYMAGTGPPEDAVWWQPFGHWAEMDSADPLSGTLRFSCRRCSRDTRVTAERLTLMFDEFAAIGVYTVDISYLPF